MSVGVTVSENDGDGDAAGVAEADLEGGLTVIDDDDDGLVLSEALEDGLDDADGVEVGVGVNVGDADADVAMLELPMAPGSNVGALGPTRMIEMLDTDGDTDGPLDSDLVRVPDAARV